MASKSKKIVLSKEFQTRLIEQFDTKKEAFEFINTIARTSFFPIQKISDAMKLNTQIGFNIKQKEIHLIDPFNLCGGSNIFKNNI